MSEFQESTRKVRDDRREKIKKARKKKRAQKDDKSGDEKAKDQDQNKEDGGDEDLGDVVGEKDAEDEKAPRYSGISSYTWAPSTAEFLFVSQGDIYRFKVEDQGIERLTKTQETERGVAYLPDGSGYTYMRGSALMRVSFGSHLIEQLDPELKKGESMSGYRLSPDGKRLTFLTRKSVGKAPPPP